MAMTMRLHERDLLAIREQVYQDWTYSLYKSYRRGPSDADDAPQYETYKSWSTRSWNGYPQPSCWILVSITKAIGDDRYFAMTTAQLEKAILWSNNYVKESFLKMRKMGLLTDYEADFLAWVLKGGNDGKPNTPNK